MRKYTEEEVVRLCKPNRYNYVGMSEKDKKELYKKYKMVRDYYDENEITILTQIELNEFMKKIGDKDWSQLSYVDKTGIINIALTGHHGLHSNYFKMYESEGATS